MIKKKMFSFQKGKNLFKIRIHRFIFKSTKIYSNLKFNFFLHLIANLKFPFSRKELKIKRFPF